MTWEFSWRPFLAGLLIGCMATSIGYHFTSWQFWAVFAVCIMIYFLGRTQGENEANKRSINLQ